MAAPRADTSSSGLQQTLIVATSSDPLAQGTASAFKHAIPPFSVESPTDYVISLVDISFDHSGTGEIFVNTNLVGFSRIGSQLVQTLFRVPTLPAGSVHVQQTGSIVKWLPYGPYTTASYVEVTLTDAYGAFIPASGVTTLTMSIRKL